MDSTILCAAVRSELGKLPVGNTVDIADTDIVREGDYILSRIAQKVTKKVPRYITSVQGQREYAVNIGTIRVLEVLPTDNTIEEELNIGSHIVSESPLGDEDYNFPSLWMIRMARRAKALRSIRFDFNPIERLLKIDPTPTIGSKIYWYISIESAGWTLANVPADFVELVVAGTTWKCLTIVALRRSTEGGIERGGGRVDYPASALKDFIDSYKQDFEDQLDVKAKIYSI